jgi:CheY-like chemotaxis protein
MCHVLIIEDEPFVALMLQDLFETAGASSTVVAATEADAIFLAMERRPAIISSDVKLIEGNGPHAVEAIRARLGEVPVIFITATPEDCTPCRPADRILTKPVNQPALATAFHELTSSSVAEEDR